MLIDRHIQGRAKLLVLMGALAATMVGYSGVWRKF